MHNLEGHSRSEEDSNVYEDEYEDDFADAAEETPENEVTENKNETENKVADSQDAEADQYLLNLMASLEEEEDAEV